MNKIKVLNLIMYACKLFNDKLKNRNKQNVCKAIMQEHTTIYKRKLLRKS